MDDFAWRPLVKDARLAGGIVPPFTIALVAGERGHLLVRLTLLLVLMRLPLVPLPLFWLRGSEMKALGRQTIKSRGPP